MRIILTPTTVGDLKPGDIISHRVQFGPFAGEGAVAGLPVLVVTSNTVTGDAAKAPVNRVAIEKKP